ncbi:hypothetical protein BDQ17DRAFT_1543766 [Cyathus striatus]|nr:hypothetical protein BDQ17DRAFT_1543766 [Cyathus striatus]
MSLPGPPQLHLSIPANATSFKRNFEQFGLDLDDGPSPIVDSPHSDLDGQGRNKRARSEASFASVASASSSSSASGSSVTMASIRSPGESTAGPESESSMEGDGDLEALPSPASAARSVHADSHNLPPVPPQASSSTATTAIDEIVMEPMELDVPVPVSVPHTHSTPPSQEDDREKGKMSKMHSLGPLPNSPPLTQTCSIEETIIVLSISYFYPYFDLQQTSTTTNSTPPRLPTPRIHTPPPTLTLPPLVGSRLTLDLGSISGADRDRGLDHGPSASGDSNSNSDLDLDLESDLDDWEIVQGERVQMNGNRDPEGRERNGNEGTGHLAEGAASQLALMMGNEGSCTPTLIVGSAGVWAVYSPSSPSSSSSSTTIILPLVGPAGGVVRIWAA